MSCCGSLFVNLGGGGGGSINTGVLQIAGGVPLDSTLRFVEDQAGTDSVLQLSTTQVSVLANQGFSQSWYNSGGTANARSVYVYQLNNQWSLYSRNDLNNSGEEFLNMTSAGPNVTSLSLGKSSSYLVLSANLATLASSNLVVGHTTASARLHVKGDGTNPTLLTESSAGVRAMFVNASNQTLWGSAGANEPYIVNYNGTSTEAGTGNALRIRQRANLNGTLIQYWADGIFNNTTSGTNISHHFLASGYAGAAGNGLFRMAQFNYTINNSGAQSGTATGIFLNATETALNGMAHNLMDLQVGGSSKFLIDNLGSVTSQKYTSANLSTGTLTTARPMQFGDKGTVTTGNDLGLDAQIAVEHNGQVYYIPCSTVLLT
jgi:hypothetical protein